MTLPVNIGLNSNYDTNTLQSNVTSPQTQLQSSQEVDSTFSSSFNVDNNISLQDLTVNSELITRESKVKNFISGESIPSNKKIEVELVFSIENNKNNILNQEIIQSIKDYNTEIVENFYENIENKSSMLLSINNNEEKYFSNFFSEVLDFSVLKNKISEAVSEKTERIKSNNFETLLKNYIFNGGTNDLFNLVSSNFVSNINFERQKNIKVLNKVLQYDKVQKTLPLQINLNDFLKKHCFFETSISNDQESKDIRSIINDVNVQNVVTMVRNLFFMSPNTHVGNYFQEEIKNFINLEKENLRVFTSENDNIDYFIYINNNNKVDIESFLEENSLKQIPESELTYSRGLSLSNSIDEVNGKQYITSNVKNYVNDVMIEKLKNVNHIKQSNYLNIGLVPPSSVIVSRELNKIFTGEFFDVNLSQYDIVKDEGIGVLSSYILTSAFGASGFPESVDNDANNLFVENYTNRSNEIIYRFNSSITKYENKSSSRDNKGDILSSDRFNVDDSSIYYLDDLYLKNKIDSFVKNQKLNLIKNKDVDLQFANDIINNIKNSSIKNKLLSYCKSDKENIAVLSSENQLFKLFFTEDNEEENTFYSHIDLVSNHTIDDSIFKGIDEMKSLDIEANSEYIEISNNIKKIISLYYQENNLFSSSLFFKKIIESILNEINIIEDFDYEENNLTQILYFNFFKKGYSKDNDAKKIIAERFIKKAVQFDIVSSSSFKRNSSLESFKYKHEDVLQDDFDNESKESIKSYIDSVLETSEKLKKIKSSVFSVNNIKNLKNISDYKRISNMNFINDGYSSEFGINLFSISSILNLNLLPNYCMLYNFKSSGVFREDAEVSYEIENKNKVKERIEFGDINPETGEREIISTKYFVDRSISEFDVTNSSEILVKVFPKLCLNDESRKNHAFPHIIIKDNFEKIFENTNYSSFAFGKIIEFIQDILRMSVKDYLDLSINNEADIDNIIENNASLVNEVISLLEIYSDFYLIYSSRIQRLHALKVFNWQKKEIANSVFINGTNNALPLNGIISKHSSVYSNFKDAMNLSNSDNVSIIDKEEVMECFSDLKEIVDEFNQNSLTYLENNLIDYDAINFKTHITYLCKNIMHSLYLSDFAQAINFDLVNGFLNHQNKIIVSDREEISSSEKFKDLNDLGITQEFVEDIETNFYDMFYLNRLSKIMSYISIKNNSNFKYIDDCYKKLGSSFHLNKNIFEKLKTNKLDMTNNLGSQIENSYNLQNYTFFDNSNDYLNSSFKTFALRNEGLKNKNSKSIIKIKVSIVDKFNLNRLYMPKIFLFSPLITNTNELTQSLLDDNNISLSNKKIGFFNSKNNILSRSNIQNIESLLNIDTLNLKSIIKNKFNSITEDDASLLYRYLISCHVSSFEIQKLLKYCYSINISHSTYKSKISKNTFSLVENLSEKQFFDVFNFRKEDVLNNILYNEEEDNYILPKRSEIIKEKCFVYDTLIKLENMSSLKQIENIKDEKYYDYYNIAINPSQFYFIDIASNNTNLQEELLQEEDIKEIEKVFAKINNLNEFKSSNTIFKKSTSLIDDFNVIFETEVL